MTPATMNGTRLRPRPSALRYRDRVRHLRVGRVALRGRGVLVEEQRVRAVARLVLVDDDVTDAGECEGLGRGQHAAGGREGGPHRSRVGISLRRIGLARARDDRSECAQLRRSLDRSVGARGERADRGVADDGRLARARLDEDDGQGVQIGAPVDRRTAGLFGRDVARRADERARRLRPRGLGERAGKAEVGDAHDAVRVEQEVPGLDVAVDDAAAMGVRERRAHLPADVRRLLGCEAVAGVEHGSQRAALEELEHHERRRRRPRPSRTRP